jgi:DNA modification methylase
MQIEKININEIKPYPNNAKLHPEEHINQIMASILEFGNNDPIAIDENNVVVEGHGRLEALKKMGYEEVEVIKLSHLTEDQKKAYIIAHNKLTMNTDFDLEKLNKELQSLSDDFQELTGFTDEEISEIFDSLTTKEEKNIVEPEESEPVSKLGDIWVLDKHKVLCGSSTEEESYKKILNGELIDLVVTDPPYNINAADSKNTINEALGNSFKRHKDIENDKIEDFDKFISSFFINTKCNMKTGAPIYVFYAHSENTFIQEFDKLLFRHQILEWDKGHSYLSRFDYHPQKEPIIYGWKEGSVHKWYGGYSTSDVIQDDETIKSKILELQLKSKKELIDIIKNVVDNAPIETDIFYHPKPSTSDLHPTMKPVNLLKRLMRNSSLKDDLVFDGFLGSGSTLIASEQLSRKCYGIELDERYVDAIVKRYIQYKEDNNEPYEVKLIRDGKEIKLEDTGLLDEDTE